MNDLHAPHVLYVLQKQQEWEWGIVQDAVQQSYTDSHEAWQERGKAIAAAHQAETDTLERFHQAVIDGGLDADHTAWIAAVAEWHGRGEARAPCKQCSGRAIFARQPIMYLH